MNTRYTLIVALMMLGTAGFTATDAEGQEATIAPTTTQTIEVPQSAGSGPGKEVTVLLDQEHLKIATISLRQGTVLPPHSAPVPATILVLEGRGITNLAGKAVPVTEGTLISMAAGEDHDVVPESGTDMLLLVHYLRSAQDRTSP